MLTDMAPTATAAGQFYGSQIQTMGITNLAPHIQKAVSITGMTKNLFPDGAFMLTIHHVVATSEKHRLA